VTRPDLGPGWVDRFVPVHGDTNEEQLMRARGRAPTKVRPRAAMTAVARRGARKGAESRHVDEVLGEVLPEESDDGE